MLMSACRSGRWLDRILDNFYADACAVGRLPGFGVVGVAPTRRGAESPNVRLPGSGSSSPELRRLPQCQAEHRESRSGFLCRRGLAAKKTEIWEKVREKLVTGKIATAARSGAGEKDIAAVTIWIEDVDNSGYASDNPGRLVARRLNRVEYNNTIRDLLAVRSVRRTNSRSTIAATVSTIWERANGLADADGEVSRGRRDRVAPGGFWGGAARQAYAPRPSAESSLARC